MSLTYTDIFCGAGGSSIGLTAAGMTLKLAANHWDRAIETHQHNFPDAIHLCEDINRYDKRKLPRTDILWASPICTEISPAGGRTGRKVNEQLDLLDQDERVPSEAFERTRATFWDVISATEIHRYKMVLVENVVEVASKWELFDEWLLCMAKLGYNHQFVSVSAAHIGDETNPHAPQWRDRLYIVLNHKTTRAPDVDPRPLAWCQNCSQIVNAYQSWKKPGARRIGKYGQQYVYRCPNIAACKHTIVEPFVRPAAAAIDWTDLGTPIGSRVKSKAKPDGLAPATIRRIRAGLEKYAQPVVAASHGNTYERPGSDYFRAWPAYESPTMARTGTPGDGLAVPPFTVPAGGTWRDGPASLEEPMPTRTARETDGMVVPPFMFAVNHDGEGRHFLPDARPLPSRTTKIGEGIVIPPLVGELRRNSTTRAADEDSLNTVTAGGNHHFMTVPPGSFIQKHHGGLDYKRIEHMTKSVDEPLAAVVAKPNLSLVIPYRKGSKAYGAGEEPLSTIATREAHGLLGTAKVDIQECLFRMLKAREHLRAQRFPDSYVVLGNPGEQTMQAGNAVASNVAQWIASRVIKALS